MMRKRITRLEDAIQWLHDMRVEIIGITGGWILRTTDDSDPDREITCDSDAELIDYVARLASAVPRQTGGSAE